jgi:hypothetical protein
VDSVSPHPKKQKKDMCKKFSLIQARKVLCKPRTTGALFARGCRENQHEQRKKEGKKLSLTIKRAINLANELIEVLCMSMQEARQGYQEQEAAAKPVECEGRSLSEEAAKENYE